MGGFCSYRTTLICSAREKGGPSGVRHYTDEIEKGGARACGSHVGGIDVIAHVISRMRSCGFADSPFSTGAVDSDARLTSHFRSKNKVCDAHFNAAQAPRYNDGAAVRVHLPPKKLPGYRKWRRDTFIAIARSKCVLPYIEN